MKRLLLVGAGHAHAQVLRDWARAPVPGVELTVVSPEPLAPYSGMVPGWLAGDFSFEDICIDFAALCRAAGAQFVRGELAHLDLGRQQAHLTGGQVLDHDLLSINVGSTLRPPEVAGPRVLALRPLGGLRQAWDAERERQARQPLHQPLRVVAVGGGAAGVEALLAVLARLRAAQPGRPVQGHLLSRGDALLPGLAPGAVRAAQASLLAAGVVVELNRAWDDAQPARLSLGPDDLLLWATGAQPHAWQAGSGLALSERGFIQVGPTLQSVSHPGVFAVGDCAEWAPPLPKAGVFAVRMGPVLIDNLRAQLQGRALRAYQPQRRFLVLLNLADGRAVASRGGWSARGRWVWHWKTHIDRSFLRGFQ